MEWLDLSDGEVEACDRVGREMSTDRRRVRREDRVSPLGGGGEKSLKDLEGRPFFQYETSILFTREIEIYRTKKC